METTPTTLDEIERNTGLKMTIPELLRTTANQFELQRDKKAKEGDPEWEDTFRDRRDRCLAAACEVEIRDAKYQRIKAERDELRANYSTLVKMHKDRGEHIHCLIEKNRELKSGTYIAKMERELDRAQRIEAALRELLDHIEALEATAGADHQMAQGGGNFTARDWLAGHTGNARRAARRALNDGAKVLEEAAKKGGRHV